MQKFNSVKSSLGNPKLLSDFIGHGFEDEPGEEVSQIVLDGKGSADAGFPLNA